jgi:hypothetical protein
MSESIELLLTETDIELWVDEIKHNCNDLIMLFG